MATNTASSILETSVGKDIDCERVFKRFTFQCLQIIVQSRIEPPVQGKDASNDYFSINLPDCHSIDEQIRQVLEGIRTYPIRDKSICVEIFLKTADGDHMFLETWDLTFNLSSLDMSACKIQHIFTRMGLALKSLLCATRITPAYRLAKNQGETTGGYLLNYRFYLGPPKTHLLGEDFKKVRAGALPSAYGLLSINVAYRTKLLLSPNNAISSSSAMQVTDDHFMRVEGTEGLRQSHAYSEPKPCHPSYRRCSVASPDHKSATPYHYSLSPSSQGTEYDLMVCLPLPDNPPWPLSRILNIEELQAPAVGAFSAQRPQVYKVEESDLPFEGLMKKSVMARLEHQHQRELRNTELDSGFGRSEDTRKVTAADDVNDDEKENAGVLNLHSTKGALEDDYVIVDPPFAFDEDPRDVKSFLGTMFRAPHLYDGPDVGGVTVEAYLTDVGDMMTLLEKDMPVIDEFCQSVINFNSMEDEDVALFS